MRDTLTPLLSAGESAGSGRLRRSLFVGLFAALVTLALVVPPAAVGDGAAVDEWPWDVQPGADSDTFPLVAELDFYNEDGTTSRDVSLIGIDPSLHLAVFFDGDEDAVRLVDTRTLEKLDVIEIDLPGFGSLVSGLAEIDTVNHRLFLPALTTGADIRDREGAREACDGFEDSGAHEVEPPKGFNPLGNVVNLCNNSDPAASGQPAIITVSLTGEHDPVVARVNSATQESPFDSAIVAELAYHSPTDNVYAVTEASQQPARPDTVLHEFPASDLASPSDGFVEAVWSYELSTCDRLSTNVLGGFVARSHQGDFAYLACVGTTTGGSLGASVGMHGVVRVDLNAGSGPSDTSQYVEHFHPFAADLEKGGATLDMANDLVFFVGNSAAGNRLFTFDAYEEAWTGASALPETGNVTTVTANPQTGRVYVLTDGGGEEMSAFRVTEANRVSVPNGTTYDAGIVKHSKQMTFDPSTRRLFVQGPQMCFEWSEEWQSGEWDVSKDTDRCVEQEGRDVPHFRVFEDRVPDAPPPEPYDFDQDTEDVSDIDGPVFSSAAANATAFGSRYLLVGGTQSSRLSEPLAIQRDLITSAPVGPSARDVVRAEVGPTYTTRFTGTPNVVASATGLNFGEQTGSDIKSNTRLASEEQDPTGLASGRDWPDDFPEEMRGYQAYCDDFGGDPNEDAKPGAAVSCDSLEQVGQAGALYTAVDEQAPVQVGYAETSVEVREDDSSGAVATATAAARDIDLFGQISIGEIRTEGTAIAHGRPGTAATELTRQYRQVRVGDSFACGWGQDDECDIWEVAREINALMQPRLVASVPAQDTTLNPDASDEPDDQPGEARVSNGTPGGAKAGVTLDPYDARSNDVTNQDQRTELPGLQIVYYDDHRHASRHIFQFAAVNLDTYYTVNSAPTFDPPDWANGDGGLGGGDDGVGDGAGPGDGLTDNLGGAAMRTVTPPRVMALGEEPVAPADEPDVGSSDTSVRAGDAEAPKFEADDGTSGLEQGQAPSLGTAEGPTVSTGEGAPAPEVAPDASVDEEPVVAQGEQGSSGPGGLMLTRQRMGETVPLAVLWVLAALPFYLAARRRRLLASSTR